MILMGWAESSIAGAWGGTLWVEPVFIVPFSLAGGGVSIPFAIPSDDALCGLKIVVQALESDPGAPAGVSATQGMRTFIGR